MTKKDYIMIASLIKSARHHHCKTKQQRRIMDILSSECADIFLTESSRFNEKKWWDFLNKPIVEITTK